MPYIQRKSRASVATNHSTLVERIVDELKPSLGVGFATPLGRPKYEAPHVIEGTLRNSDRLEVYVIWTKWLGVKEEHRTAAIVDAYEKAFGSEKAKLVVIALGVTPEEAKDLGISTE